MDRIAWVYPNICLGAGYMLTPRFVNAAGITHVINCGFPEHSPEWFRRRFSNRSVGINAIDSPTVKILDWYPMFEEAMRQFLRVPGSIIFVHCQAGINRSAYLLIYFMVKNFGCNFKTLLSGVRLQRPQVCQNKAFMEEIEQAIFTSDVENNNGCVQGEEDS